MKRSRYKYDVPVDDEFRITKEIRALMNQNGIKKYSWYTDEEGQRHVTFMSETDAMAFKLLQDDI